MCFLFFQSHEWGLTQSCMEWLFDRAGVDDNYLHKIYVLEDMVRDLYGHVGESITENSVKDLLSSTTFDFEAHTRSA